MTTATIKKEYVKILRKEYDALVLLKKIIPLFRATKAEQKVIARGEKEIRMGRYQAWNELKHELENTRDR